MLTLTIGATTKIVKAANVPRKFRIVVNQTLPDIVYISLSANVLEDKTNGGLMLSCYQTVDINLPAGKEIYAKATAAADIGAFEINLDGSVQI